MIPGLGRSPGGGHGNPLQYSCLENLMDRGAWRATVHGVTQSQTRLSDQAQHREVKREIRNQKPCAECCHLQITQKPGAEPATDTRPGPHLLCPVSQSEGRTAEPHHPWVWGWKHRLGSGARQTMGAPRAELGSDRSWCVCRVCSGACHCGAAEGAPRHDEGAALGGPSCSRGRDCMSLGGRFSCLTPALSHLRVDIPGRRGISTHGANGLGDGWFSEPIILHRVSQKLNRWLNLFKRTSSCFGTREFRQNSGKEVSWIAEVAQR